MGADEEKLFEFGIIGVWMGALSATSKPPETIESRPQIAACDC